MISQTGLECAHRCLSPAAEITAKAAFSRKPGISAHGKPFDPTVENEILESLKPDYIKGLTLLGGDPFEPENQEALVPFLKRVKEQFPEKNIWACTGYILDRDLTEGGKCCTKDTPEMLKRIDVLVDGPFVEEKKDITLKFKGSSNQRVTDLKKFCKEGVTETLWQ